MIRPDDIDRSGAVWVYVPENHKTEHHGKARRIYIGPHALKILEPWLAPSNVSTAYLFDPRQAIAENLAKQEASRLTRRKKWQAGGPGRPPKAKPTGWKPKWIERAPRIGENGVGGENGVSSFFLLWPPLGTGRPRW